MTIQITTPDMRAEEELFPTGLILGLPGSGKTHLIKTLPAEETLFIDVEGGDMTIKGDSDVGISIRPQTMYSKSKDVLFQNQSTWENLRDIAVIFCGADINSKEKVKYKLDRYVPYSQQHYDAVFQEWGEKMVNALKNKIKYVYLDTITKASHLCKRYTDAHATSVTKNGAFDGMGSYGLTRAELDNFATLWKEAKEISFWMGGHIATKIEKIGTNPVVEITKHTVDADGSFKLSVVRIPDVVLLLEVSKDKVDENGVPLRRFRTSGKSKDLPGLELKKRKELNETEPADLTLLIKKLTSKKVKEVKKVEEKGEK